jgi:cytolysin (calcineurin-like family phosphatase)
LNTDDEESPETGEFHIDSYGVETPPWTVDPDPRSITLFQKMRNYVRIDTGSKAVGPMLQIFGM